MFTKILIANRGEIACRVIDTCRLMGVATVAVYSEADRHSRHVSMADEAIYIGASPVSESYLQGARLIKAALDGGAEAIHPGFGFLSENPDFVEAVEAAGLTFIGPSAEAIRAMGLKDTAKAHMQAAGVAVVPGYHGDNQDASFLTDEAEKIGYPVLIKARAGGGGKGMRRVDDPADFAEALASAVRESVASFGDGRVLIEKYVNNPRHIEMQVFGDCFGTIVHLFERDCSLQRRHQKVIEEAPAPGMTSALRQAMCDAAIKAAKAIDYQGAGTVEFIVDGSNLNPDGFWFMEMNTRLQVEHPVTEAITGVDLVEWQLRVAAGEALPLAQDEIAIEGHAFEARIYAEDPTHDFLPQTGALYHLQLPQNARVETGVREEDIITAFYDPMIAKVITHGSTRNEALEAMTAALEEMQVVGCVTNVNFLHALTRHQGFVGGDLDTGLIARDGEVLLKNCQPTKDHHAIAALIGFGAFEVNHPYGAWQLWGQPSRDVTLHQADEAFSVKVSKISQDRYQVYLSGSPIEIERMDDGDLYQHWFEIDGHQQLASLIFHPDGVTVFLNGLGIDYRLENSGQSGSLDETSSNVIIAPMPGLITACSASVDGAVSKGDILFTMEAMKMEHAMAAPFDGIVTELNVEAGQQVEKGAVLTVLSEADNG